MRARQLRKWPYVLPILVLALATGYVLRALSEGARQQVVLTPRALRHIQQRHWPDSSAQGVGKFAIGITEESLRQMINEAVAYGDSRQNTHGRLGKIYEYDFGRPIGTRINGGPASRLRVVISVSSQVVTAFPF
jgi:hypothetical protein